MSAAPTDSDTIAAVPLSYVFELANVGEFSFVKMDVEGAEYEVFLDVRSDLLQRIERLAIEYHDNYRAGAAALIRQKLSPTHQVTVLPDRGELHGRLFAVRHDLVGNVNQVS